MVPLAGLEPARMLLRGILSPLRLPIPPQRHMPLRAFNWRHHPESNWGIKVLQTSALPLGYGAIMERETRFELATFALARQRSTTEPLPRATLFMISKNHK